MFQYHVCNWICHFSERTLRGLLVPTKKVPQNSHSVKSLHFQLQWAIFISSLHILYYHLYIYSSHKQTQRKIVISILYHRRYLLVLQVYAELLKITTPDQNTLLCTNALLIRMKGLTHYIYWAFGSAGLLTHSCLDHFIQQDILLP